MERSIIVPKTAIALEALDFGNEIVEELIEFNIEESLFVKLWHNGFWQRINFFAGIHLDAWEDDRIIDIFVLKELVDGDLFNIGYNNSEIDGAVSKVKSLFVEAIKYNTGIFFYF